MSKTVSSPSGSALSAEDELHRDLATAMITFHEAVARRLGVTAADQRVLGVLGRMGVATPSRLAESTGLTTGAITGIVDRLERAGFAKRVPNPADPIQYPFRRALGLTMARPREVGVTLQYNF